MFHSVETAQEIVSPYSKHCIKTRLHIIFVRDTHLRQQKVTTHLRPRIGDTLKYAEIPQNIENYMYM